MLGPFFPGKARRLLVRQEKRALSIEASFYGKSDLLSYAKKVAKKRQPFPGRASVISPLRNRADRKAAAVFALRKR